MTIADRKKAKADRSAANKKAHAAKQKEVVKAHQPVSTKEGSKTRMAQLREKLLSTGNSETVLRKLMEIVRNDEHPAQGAMIKLCADRMMPVSMFEDKAQGTPMINITFGSVGETPVIEEKKVVSEQ
tara:strand:- start:107 stop:487 length:381 start_codon:yes stop_codon:yes gene_type:complete